MAKKLKFGNGTWATKEGSTLAYNDENENFKPLPFSFTRDSIATRVNKEGLIEVVGKDKPRIDYTDSSDGVLLLENSATNFITYSEDFTDTIWSKNISDIVSSNTIISPKGDLTADTLTENTTTNAFACRYSNAVSYTSGSKYTTSIFAKTNGRDLMIRSYNGSSDIDTIFDLSNGIVLSGNDAKIEDFGNGWYRCSHTITAQSTINTAFSASFILVNNSSITYQGDGTSGVYIWGAMLEQNSIASSYIPTSGSTVQRAAETANGAGNSEVFNDSEGVLFADYKPVFTDGSRQLTLNDNTYDNRIVFECRDNGTKLRANVWSGGANEMQIDSEIPSINLYYKCAIKYKINDGAFWINGFKIDVANITSVPSGMNNISFSGKNDNSLKVTGKTKEIAYYDTALTDEELEYLTSYRSLNELVTELNLNTL